jgi:putative ABC transport system permease protein
MILSAEFDRLRILSLRDLLAHPSRHLTSVVVVTVCSALLVAVFGIFGSVVGSVDDLARDISGHATLQISANSSGGVPADLLKPIRRVDGVQVAAPLVISTVPIDGQRTLLIGVDPSLTGIGSRLGQAVLDQEGSSAVTTGGGVIVGSHMSAKRGSGIEVFGHRLDVAMVLDSEMAGGINNGRFIIAPMRTAQTLIGRPDAYDSILIVTDGGASVSQVRKQIDVVTQGRVITSEPLLGAEKKNTILVYLRDSTMLIASMSLIVAMFFVFNTLNMAIVRRRRAFATMRAIGARQSEIWRYVFGEAFIIGLAGGLLGAPIGVLAGRLAISVLPEAVVNEVSASVTYHRPPFAIPMAIAVSVVSCMAAALGGVRQSRRLSPIEAVGRADMRQVDEFTQPLRVSVGIVSALLLAGSAYAALYLNDAQALIACIVFLLSGLGLCYAFAELMVAIVGFAAARLGSVGVTASLVIARARGRVWVTTMVVIVAVAVGVCGSGQMSNLVSTMSTLAAPLKTVPLLVSSAGSELVPTGPVLPSDLQTRIQDLPDVAKIVAGQYAYGTVDGKRVLLQGAVPGTVTPGFDSLDPGSRAALFGGDGVVISRQLTKQIGVGVGGTIVLQCPTGQRTVKVIGVIDYVTAAGAGLVVMSLDSLRRWYSRPGTTYLQVHLRDGANVAATQQAIAAILPAGVQVYTGEAVYGEVMRGVAVIGRLSLALQLIIAAVVTVGIFNTFLVAVIERRREIAVFGAIGADRSFVVRAVLAEAAAIGLVGGVCGTAIGLITQYIVGTVLSNGIGLSIHFRPDPTFVLYPVIAIALCMASAGGAAVQAARRNIVEAISDR